MFNPDFILSHSKAGTKPDLVKTLREMQEKLCEDANPLVEALITDLDAFATDAISADGRGRFLAMYDGEELEVGQYFTYRIN